MATPDKSLKVTTQGEREIRIERVVDAPPDRVWTAFLERDQIVQWWGRGNRVVVERWEPERGGHWRFVEHSSEGTHGFEGRFREIVPKQCIEQTFEWDGMPGHVSVDRMTLEDCGDGRTKVVTTSLFLTAEDRDGMLQAGMEEGLAQSYAALDRLLGARHADVAACSS